MTKVFLKKNPFALVVVLLIAVVFGWIVYRFASADQISLRDIPPALPPIVSRTDWAADPLNLEAPDEFGAFDAQTNPAGVLTYPNDLRNVLNTIVVHHSAFPNAGPKEIQELHMNRRGFADVAYHFMIAADGTIYEGRQINIRGAHVQGFNTGSVGIVLMGNFNDEQPTESQLGR